MNGLPRFEGWIARGLRRAAETNGFLGVCAALAFAGSVSASYPVTAVVVPAALLVPHRWIAVSAVCAVGSALGATVLVIAFHFLGWSQLHGAFPEMVTHPKWQQVIEWVQTYGVAGLFAVAVSPLPQTPALAFFGIARHDYLAVFLAIFAGKALKYSVFAWAAARFPERFRGDHSSPRDGRHRAARDAGPPSGTPP